MAAINSSGGSMPPMQARGVTDSIHNLQTIATRMKTGSGPKLGDGPQASIKTTMRAPETGKGTVIDTMG